MPFAARHRDDAGPALAPLPGLTVHRIHDAAWMAALQKRDESDIAHRFSIGHRAYVAFVNETPAAWGWVATQQAQIGELGFSFVIPRTERYLWNFVTLAEHRGRGIYPRLLEAIVQAECTEAERFWIAYAPENHASGVGILKAGFVTVAEISFDSNGRAAVGEHSAGGGRIASAVLGLPVVQEPLTQCWRCVRAGRAAMSCAPGECRCDYQQPERECAA